MRLIHRGKVKDVYELTNDNALLFHFSDRISAFDIQMNRDIPGKGEVLCKFAKFWFENLATPNHMLGIRSEKEMLVKKLKMIPIECVVRGYFYGSLIDRYKNGDKSLILPPSFVPVIATELPEPLFDPTTKSEKHDIPISKGKMLSLGLLSINEYNYVKEESLSLYKSMKDIASAANFILADVKFEFGRDSKSKIILADSLGPDEYRLWLKSNYQAGKLQESYDKQVLRDWLTEVGFKKIVEQYASQGLKPPSPDIPQDLVAELKKRYIFAYEAITKSKFTDC
ncbi:MAG TPA: phosphoribosylaminoimidazolesuccinocarboxamide synthase [Nitrososphaeraceae archaeon]|nr:phosphoribosylaminoimidazolesuccinocarboxamide synthase [Nitrososphaeraceae archaeon]